MRGAEEVRKFFGLFLAAASGLYLALAIHGGTVGTWESVEMAWERCRSLAEVKGLRCGTLEEQRAWFDSQRLSQSIPAVIGILLGLYLAFYREVRYRLQGKIRD